MFSTIGKNEALDGMTVDKISLHTGDPGASGTDNEVSGDGYARQSATFNSAASGERALGSPVEFDGPAHEDVLYVGIWEAGAPDIFKAAAQVEGDTSFNAEGEFILTSARLRLEECE